MSNSRARAALFLLASGLLIIPGVAQAQFGPPGSGCTYTTLQAAITNAISTGSPEVYVAIPAGGALSWTEDVTVAVPAGELVHIVPADARAANR